MLYQTHREATLSKIHMHMHKGSQAYTWVENKLHPWWKQRMKRFCRQMGLRVAMYFLTTSERPWEL